MELLSSLKKKKMPTISFRNTWWNQNDIANNRALFTFNFTAWNPEISSWSFAAKEYIWIAFGFFVAGGYSGTLHLIEVRSRRISIAS